MALSLRPTQTITFVFALVFLIGNEFMTFIRGKNAKGICQMLFVYSHQIHDQDSQLGMRTNGREVQSVNN